MSSNRSLSLAGGLVFLCLAALALYRLLVGFPMTIGGMHIGQTASFFAFVAFAAMSLVLFRGSRSS
jgi:hypothetical protein